MMDFCGYWIQLIEVCNLGSTDSVGTDGPYVATLISTSLGSLPAFVQQRIHHLEKQQRYDSPEYEAINAVLTTFFTVRTAPGPDFWHERRNGWRGSLLF